MRVNKPQVSVGLPRRHVADVVVPLLALRSEEVFEQMLAERLAHQVVFLELVERLAQVPGSSSIRRCRRSRWLIVKMFL